MNPWNLTPTQEAVMDAVCEHGSHKLAAQALRLSVRTVEAHTAEAKFKLDAKTRLMTVLLWDRWRNRRGVAA